MGNAGPAWRAAAEYGSICIEESLTSRPRMIRLCSCDSRTIVNHRLTANKLPLEETRGSFKDLKNIYLQKVAGLGSYEQAFQESKHVFWTIQNIEPGCAHHCKNGRRASKRFGSRQAAPSHQREKNTAERLVLKSKT
jgi:hypothetical protein